MRGGLRGKRGRGGREVRGGRRVLVHRRCPVVSESSGDRIRVTAPEPPQSFVRIQCKAFYSGVYSSIYNSVYCVVYSSVYSRRLQRRLQRHLQRRLQRRSVYSVISPSPLTASLRQPAHLGHCLRHRHHDPPPARPHVPLGCRPHPRPCPDWRSDGRERGAGGIRAAHGAHAQGLPAPHRGPLPPRTRTCTCSRTWIHRDVRAVECGHAAVEMSTHGG